MRARTLALDLGRSAGWAVVDRGAGAPAESGTWTGPGDPGIEARSAAFAEWLRARIRESGVTEIVVEKVRMWRGRSWQVAVAQLRQEGIVLAEAGRAGVPVGWMDNTEWKAAACGDGAADKRSLAVMTAMLCGRSSWRSQDEADACGLAIAWEATRALRGGGE